MSIEQTLSTNQNAIGIFNLNDLMEFAKAIRREAIEDAKQEMAQEQEQNEKDDELLTVSQTAEFLHIDRSTLYRYMKLGYVHPVNTVGERKRFRKSDLIKFNKGQR